MGVKYPIRTSHKFVSPKQFRGIAYLESSQKRELREPYAPWAVPVYPVFVNKIDKVSDRKSHSLRKASTVKIARFANHKT